MRKCTAGFIALVYLAGNAINTAHISHAANADYVVTQQGHSPSELIYPIAAITPQFAAINTATSHGIISLSADLCKLSTSGYLNNFAFSITPLANALNTIGFYENLYIAINISIALKLFSTNTKSLQTLEPRQTTPLEYAGRDIYFRELCYVCHKQVDDAKSEDEFSWGSKRSAPDLVRGEDYLVRWRRAHMLQHNTLDVGDFSNLSTQPLKYDDIADQMEKAQFTRYTPEQISNAKVDLEAQTMSESGEIAGLVKRYPHAKAYKFDGNRTRISELDALLTYLRRLP
jgi:cytochrome c oxidase cbb3-type subunit II